MPRQDVGNSYGTFSWLETPGGRLGIHRLERLERAGLSGLSRLPVTVRILLEAALRAENAVEVTRTHIAALAGYRPTNPSTEEIPFTPARVLVQDFTGVPAMVDLAAMRSALLERGADKSRVNPRVPVDLVIDHSVQVDFHGSPDALQKNTHREFERNRERYELLHWAQKAFSNLRVVPPASGICHQVNLEHLARVVECREMNGVQMAFPDSLVGLDSHTTMINGLGVLGWGVGGIEAEAVMLGQPVYMLMPRVMGLRLAGSLSAGATATDLALSVCQKLRRHGVVGKFVEVCGPGLASLALADRATVANMAPEHGSTCCFFPADDETLSYLRQTGRPAEQVDLVERYTKEQGLFCTDQTPEPEFEELVELDLSAVVPSVAGPRRPQERIPVSALREKWDEILRAPLGEEGFGLGKEEHARRAALEDMNASIGHGAVVIAAITSCTNTSNPSVLLGAGLVAKKAVEAGLSVGPAVKTSLAPGSKVVTSYLQGAGLLEPLEQLGFHLVGYGCTTCIGNAGPLPGPVEDAIIEGDLVAAAVLSGNRNFEGRIHQRVRANFLASPMLVVAYALAGTVDIDLDRDPLGVGKDGREVYLRDIWPSPDEIEALLPNAADPAAYQRVYARLCDDNQAWNRIQAADADAEPWDPDSTYIQKPPFFDDLPLEVPPIRPIEGARVLLLLGDSVTTDHISPAGAFPQDSPAGRYLTEQGVAPEDFNSYGSRRGNDRVMTRGTFANIRIRNALAGGKEGGFTAHLPDGEMLPVYDAAMRYREEGVPLVVIAGRDYGMGSSRDWAAKGTHLLGVKAVLARSYERIHRSNLIGMGVLPLQFEQGQSAESLGLTGHELFDIPLGDDLSPGQTLQLQARTEDGGNMKITVLCRLDTPIELTYYRNGGILHTVLRDMLRADQ